MAGTIRGVGLRLLVAAGVLVATSTAAWAQAGLSTLTGIVSDSSGAAVPGTTVTATNTATNVAYVGITTDAGAYTITGLTIGSYTVRFELQGFKATQVSLDLAGGQTARVDARLEVGNLSESVEVTATSAVLQTENAVVGTKLDEKKVEALPIQGRNPVAATLYTPGVTTPNPNSFNALKNTGGGRPYVNGQREQANNFTLDGIDMNDAIDNLVAYQPSPDALQQISVETNNYSPELGNVGGAIVNMSIKSGTNQFKGNLFGYWRDNELAATPWNTNRLGGRKAELTRTIFGGTFGGPIFKDKLFFFGDYQGGRLEAPTPVAFSTVVPAEWRRGDLSSLLRSNIVVRDPLTGQPFPNNQIPLSRFGAIARNLFANEALYPLPNVQRDLSDFRANYQGSTASREQTDQFDLKFDWNASANDKLFVRYSWQDHENRTEQTVMPLAYGSLSTNPFRSVGVNWTRTFGPSLINETLFGYSKSSFNSNPLDLRGLGSLNSTLGIAGSQPIAGLSSIAIGNSVDSIGTIGIASNTTNNVFQLNQRLTWLRGRHAFKAGVMWNYYRLERFYSGNNGVLGRFAYNGQFTGVPFADFLLDQLNVKGRGSQAPPWMHLQHRLGLYLADDFKVTDKLTLNLGLRWGFVSPLVERDDRQANFDVTNAEQLLAGQNGNSRALYDPYYGGWEPRVGFAYRPTDKLVVRGGYGITQYMEGTGANLRLPLNPPFFFESEVTYDTSSGAGTAATGFEGLQALDRPSGQLRAWDTKLKPQLTQQWNLFAEYLLTDRSSLSIGYVGNSNDNLVSPTDGNQPLPGTGPTSTWLPVQQRRPLYSFNPLITSISYTTSLAYGNYNGLQTSFKQRLTGGLDFIANYTWSKAMTNNLGYYGSGGVAGPGAYYQNSYDIDADYGPAFFDARHIFTLAGSYDVPFGRDRKYGSSVNPVVDAVLGGWSISSAMTLRSGFPITVRDSDRSLQASRGGGRPDRIGSGEVDDPTLTRWIDRSAFQSAPAGEFGDSGIGILRAPGYKNVDLSITKRFLTFGSQYLVFRGEAFNVFNIPSFGPPDSNITSQNFGTITSTISDPRVVQLVLKYYF